MRKQVCCTRCHQWFDAYERACGCGAERPAWNEALTSQAWRSNLNAHAALTESPARQTEQLHQHRAGLRG